MDGLYLIVVVGFLIEPCISTVTSRPQTVSPSPATEYSPKAKPSPEPPRSPGMRYREPENSYVHTVNRKPYSRSGYMENPGEYSENSGSPEKSDYTDAHYHDEDDEHSHYCPPCLVWKRCGFPCRQECHPTTEHCKCQPGCFCPGNLKLNNDGQCVSPQLCPKNHHRTCCFGKMYTTCGSNCVQSCGVDICSKDCKEGCFCLRGTKLIDGVCQPPHKCRTCAGGRVYQKCGRRCDEICGCHHDDYPPHYCEEGCFCPRGHRIVGGVCRPDHECPPENYHYYYYYKK